MWAECGTMQKKKNKTNVGRVQNECKKKSKMAKQGVKTIQMWVRIQKIKTKNQCKKASQNVGAGR